MGNFKICIHCDSWMWIHTHILGWRFWKCPKCGWQQVEEKSVQNGWCLWGKVNPPWGDRRNSQLHEKVTKKTHCRHPSWKRRIPFNTLDFTRWLQKEVLNENILARTLIHSLLRSCRNNPWGVCFKRWRHHCRWLLCNLWGGVLRWGQPTQHH